jgi:hypothetical protein
MAVQLAKPAAPASGGPDCVCPGGECGPWCTCLACDSRPEALCHLKVGTTFGAVANEMIETLSDGGCGDHVFTRVGRDATGTLVLVFDAPGDTGDPAGRMREDPFFRALGAYDVEPVTEALCFIDAGTTFGDVLCEMVATLSDDKCGDHVFAQAGRNEKDVFVLVFDAPGDTGDSAHQPQEDPLFQMVGVDDAEPMNVDDVVYGGNVDAPDDGCE